MLHMPEISSNFGFFMTSVRGAVIAKKAREIIGIRGSLKVRKEAISISTTSTS